MEKVKKNSRGGLSLKHWMGYMFGDFGGGMTFTLMASIFTMYCTNALGIDTTLLGTLVIVWTIWDAINDPMMGALMDKAFAKRQDGLTPDPEEWKSDRQYMMTQVQALVGRYSKLGDKAYYHLFLQTDDTFKAAMADQ